MKLFDSELKVMDVIWREGDATAKRIAEVTKEEIGWSKTTTYTVIKKCVDKGAILRLEPKFICRPLVSKKEVQKYEVNELINKLYSGEVDKLIAALLENHQLKKESLSYLRDLIEGADS